MTSRRRALLDALRDEDPSVRTAASEALDRLDILEGLSELRGRLRSFEKVEWVRLLRSLVGVRELECLKLALSALAHPEEDVRLAGLDVARAFADWRASSAVSARLTDRSALVRARALEVLGDLGDRRRAPDVVRLLGDSDPTVVAAAVRSVSLLGDGSFEAALLPLLTHPDSGVRGACADALGRLGISVQQPAASERHPPDEPAG